jgi:hypothetical protein
VAPVTAAGPESYGGHRGSEQRHLHWRVLTCEQIGIVSWAATKGGIEGDDTLALLEHLSPAILKAMLEELSCWAIPLILLLLY